MRRNRRIIESKSFTNKNNSDIVYHSDELPIELSISNVETGILMVAEGYGILSLQGDMDDETYKKYKKEISILFRELDVVVKRINDYFKLKKLKISKF